MPFWKNANLISASSRAVPDRPDINEIDAQREFLSPRVKSMQDWLRARKNTSPDTTFLVVGDETLTYRQLDRLADEYVHRLQAQIALKPGDCVALLLPSGMPQVIMLFALMRLKAVIVPLNTRLTPVELQWQLQNIDCQLVIYSRKTETQIAGIAQQDWRILSIDELSRIAYPTSESSPADIVPEFNPDVPFVIIHTSGTSGQPKGAVLTYNNVFYSALASAYHIGHQPDDRWLCTLPLYHVGGLSILIRAVLYGITVHLHSQFDVDAVNHALTHRPITLVSLVPTMLVRLLEARREAWNPKLRLVLLGGAAATSDLIQRCADENIPVAATYGLSEAASQVATTLPGDAARKIGSAGRPLLFTQVRIIDAHGHDQPTGQHGEIIIRGPTIMQAYYNNPAASVHVLRDGWLHTGDIGYLDADGDLWVIQRRSDLIVSGGENIYPVEVENALRSHPAVQDAAVVGLDDAEWGQRVAAAIQLHDGYNLTEAELLAHIRPQLAGYKLPRTMRFVPALPQTASGKIQRRAVKALFEDISSCDPPSSMA